MKAMYRIVLLCLPLAMSLPVAAETPDNGPYKATVEDIAAANVFRIKHGEDGQSVLLYGALSSSPDSATGKKALTETERLMHIGDTVTVIPRATDGSILYADILLPDGRNLAHELLREGWARWDKNRAEDDPYLASLELLAQQTRKGQWRDGTPTNRPSIPVVQQYSAPASTTPAIETEEKTMPVPRRAPAGDRPGSQTLADLAPGETQAFRDENGVTHIRSKSDTDPQVIAEARRQVEEAKAIRLEIQREQEAELRRQYAAYLEQMRQQQRENQQAAMEYQEWLLDVEQKALRNEALRNRNYQNSYWNNYPYTYYGGYPVLHQVQIKHTGTDFNDKSHTSQSTNNTVEMETGAATP